MFIDLHVHTAYSEDFELPLGDAIDRCLENGIGALLLAECDVVPPLKEIQAISKERDFPVFVGIDIDTDDGRAILVPRYPEDERFTSQSWARDDGDLAFDDIIKAARDLDAVVIAAHPYLDDGGPFLGDRIYKVEGLAAIEVCCGVKRHISNDMALEAASSIGLPGVGGSDTGPEGQRLGRYATVFADEIASQEELVDALGDGTFWAVDLAQGPPERRQPQQRRGGRGPRGHGRRG